LGIPVILALLPCSREESIKRTCSSDGSVVATDRASWIREWLG
jgi:hypothetical protein